MLVARPSLATKRDIKSADQHALELHTGRHCSSEPTRVTFTSDCESAYVRVSRSCTNAELAQELGGGRGVVAQLKRPLTSTWSLRG